MPKHHQCCSPRRGICFVRSSSSRAGGKRSATHAPRMVVDQVPLSVRRRRRHRRFRRPGFIGAFGVLVARLCRSRHAVGIIAIKLAPSTTPQRSAARRVPSPAALAAHVSTDLGGEAGFAAPALPEESFLYPGRPRPGQPLPPAYVRPCMLRYAATAHVPFKAEAGVCSTPAASTRGQRKLP